MNIITLDDLEGHLEPVGSAILATAGLLILCLTELLLQELVMLMIFSSSMYRRVMCFGSVFKLTVWNPILCLFSIYVIVILTLKRLLY